MAAAGAAPGAWALLALSLCGAAAPRAVRGSRAGGAAGGAAGEAAGEAAGGIAGGARGAAVAPPRQELPQLAEGWEVDILLMRHGQSCTNLVERWGGQFDIGASKMKDPMLTGFARVGCERAAKDISAWLDNQVIDAVLSSVLLRAIETAVRTFPDRRVYAAPHIRETVPDFMGLGRLLGFLNSNLPKPVEEQVADLKGALGEEPDLKTWKNTQASEPSWKSFTTWLASSFLGKEVAREALQAGAKPRRIVLAVVSHGSFMGKLLEESKHGRKCKRFWTDQGEQTPLNTQVFRLPYLWAPADQTMAENGDCEQVSPGLDVIEPSKGPLCLRDIGEQCVGPIRRHASKKEEIWSKTLEYMAEETLRNIMRFGRIRELLEILLVNWTKHVTAECLVGGAPDMWLLRP